MERGYLQTEVFFLKLREEDNILFRKKLIVSEGAAARKFSAPCGIAEIRNLGFWKMFTLVATILAK